MPEWSNGPHSKCGIRVTVSRVRIPVSPQNPPTDRQPAHYQQAVLVIIQVCYWMLSGLSRKFRLSRIGVHQKYGVAHNNILFVKYIINEVGETVYHRI